MSSYSIKDLELITGIKAHTIRIWEKRYSLITPKRTSTNIRYYSDDDLRLLINVSLLNNHGYKISDISSMSSDELNRCLLDTNRPDENNQLAINNMLLAMMQLDEKQFEHIIAQSISTLGFEKWLTNVVAQFMNKVGLLWLTGSITPVQEHFVSNLLRKKVIIAIENEEYERPDAKTFLLFLPANEYHEIALLYFFYLLRKSGHRVIYLGQNVPGEFLLEAAIKTNPDYLMTSITIGLQPAEQKSLMHEVEKLPPKIKVLIGGKKFDEALLQLSDRFIYLDSEESFIHFIERL